jgi:hypothetical protein
MYKHQAAASMEKLFFSVRYGNAGTFSKKGHLILSYFSCFRHCMALCAGFVWVSSLSACYGLKKLKPVDTPNHCATALSQGAVVILDSNYKHRLWALLPDSSAGALRENLTQPLQFFYFQDGLLKAYSINCYTKADLFNLHWHLSEVVNNGTIAGKAKGFKGIEKVVGSAFQVAIPEKGNKVIVTCAQFLGRQNKRFLHAVKQVCAAKEIQDIHVFQMDNIFINQ